MCRDFSFLNPAEVQAHQPRVGLQALRGQLVHVSPVAPGGGGDGLEVAQIPDPAVAKRLEADFEKDLTQSREVSYDEWKSRSVLERIGERLGWLLINQS